MIRIHRLRRPAPALVAAALLGFASVAADRLPPRVLVNESASLPRGLYWRGPNRIPARGDVTAVPQPEVARAYLRGLGMPGDVLLLKRIAATGGDVVCAEAGRVKTPARSVEVRARDRRGTSLPSWNGCRRLASDELFLLGDTASSFDSRYFGPVRRAEKTGLYREVFTW